MNNSKLFVFNQSVDITRSVSVLNGSVSVSISNSNYLYIGFRKPLTSLFLEVLEGNERIEDKLKIEKWNGTVFFEVENEDNTFGLYKSGHIFLDKKSAEKEKEKTINGQKLFWIRISSAQNINANVKYINQVFCSYEMLYAVEPRLNDSDFFPAGFTSHITALCAARDYIISKVNGSGNLKFNGKVVSNVNAFDFVDLTDIQEAATYYAIYQIFLNVADNAEGVWQSLSDIYLQKFYSAYATFGSNKLTLDKNDTGVVSDRDINDSIQRITFVK